MEEYREIYLTESEEMLHSMEQELLSLEQGGSVVAIQRLFRAAHTLKGSSATMGYVQTNRLTHNMEHVLEKVRTGAWEVSAKLANLLFRCVDRIRLLQQEVAEGNRENSPIEDLLAALRGFETSASEAAAGPVAVSFPAESARVIRLRQEAGEALLRVGVTLSDQCEMREARLKIMERQLSELGTFFYPDKELSAAGAEGASADRQAVWHITASSERGVLAAEIGTWIDVAEVVVHECILAEEPSASQLPVSSDGEERNRKGKGANSTIRVNVERLEKMMNLVGELVIEQTRLSQVTKELGRSLKTEPSVSDLEHIGDRVNRVLGELQENVMKVRMLPIDQLFNRFPRMIRDLSQSLGKEVELILEGRETELDRTLIEELGDPLIHLIRNALDHGIEQPGERERAGKPVAGRLRIGASHEDNQVMIIVEDDGAGINSARLLQKAVDRRIITPEAAASTSDRDAVNLIFHPGLSTASAVSDISGRGVGMDIVKACIEKVNGMIEVDTEAGKGTRFRIRLPLTLAIGTGLLVETAGLTYIVPMNNVAEIVRMEPQSITIVNGMQMVSIRETIFPVVWLHDLFGHPAPTHYNRHIPIVVIGRGDKKIALAVEQLIGNQEIVIKSLGSFVGQVEGIAGATILGTGKVALILEIGGLFRRFSRS
ncbi:MAG: chemotaxis protein CheA [Paenibacillaceae bacterium]|jgi:two-component system chemotaxis sensor kinase CheA|nr:chemotaxis protein CheA [Paenibacillaceae bacterium]